MKKARGLKTRGTVHLINVRCAQDPGEPYHFAGAVVQYSAERAAALHHYQGYTADTNYLFRH
jgi:hypothetical protein